MSGDDHDETTETRANVARCPKCRGTSLSVIEFTDSVGVADFGEVRVEDGGLIPASNFYYEPGDITRVEMECECGHRWRSRRSVASSFAWRGVSS